MAHDADTFPEADIIIEEQPTDGDRPRRGWVGWLISASFHAALIAIMGTVYWLIVEPPTDPTPVVTVPKFTPEVKVVKEKRELEEKVELKLDVVSDVVSPLPPLEIPLEEKPQTDNDVPTEDVKGNPDNVAVQEYSDARAFMAVIGPGATSPGIWSQRGPGGHHRAVSKGGGTGSSEAAVGSALRWFKRHQSANGMWDAAKYTANCSENPKCEPGNDAVGGNVNVAMTGYAIMCFLASGYDHQTASVYRATVKKGIDYLVSVQTAEGLLGDRNYEHAIAAKALIEAYGMTNDPALREPSQKAVNVILARQNQGNGNDKAYSGLGWDYVAPGARNDSSVTGWNVMALKSALASGLNIGKGLEGSKQWLDTVWKATNPDWKKLDPYKDESRFPYTYMSDSEKIDIAPAPANATAPSAEMHDLACVGTMCAVFLGKRAGDPMLETLANYVTNHEMPTAYPCNTYKLYYNTLGVFQVGGEKWKKWNGTVRDMLVHAQRQGDGCFDGSWDFKDTKFHGSDVGRILSTAYCCLSLEVYYVYGHVNEGH